MKTIADKITQELNQSRIALVTARVAGDSKRIAKHTKNIEFLQELKNRFLECGDLEKAFSEVSGSTDNSINRYYESVFLDS